MGGEFGQVSEWVHDSSLDWDVLQYACHAQLKTFMAQLNALYRGERALYEVDWNMSGFEWIDCNDAQHSTLSLLRHAGSSEETILVVLNFTPVPRYHYRVGVPRMGFWRELLNSDAREYGGSGHGNLGGAEASPVPYHGRPCSLNLTLPPLGAIFFKL
jgi:1,4-alpha-glucan branching enzyme